MKWFPFPIESSRVTLAYAGPNAPPPHEQFRLRAALRDAYPGDDGPPVWVQVSWEETREAWRIRSATSVTSGKVTFLTVELAAELRGHGLLVLGRPAL